jgi:DNA polymerase-1
MNENKKTLILIDGHALAYRSFFALERTGMKTAKGQPTWAVYGFFHALFDLLKKVKPDAMAVSFDMGRETFRTEVYKEYKANRDGMPDHLKEQMGFLHEGLEAMDIPIYQLKGFEADDIIGTIAYKAKALGHQTFILTGDRDSFQLVDREGLIKVLIPSKGILDEYDTQKVYERMGVYPEQIIDYKALCGDSSDNIPGIRGIGDKTAVKLLTEYQNLENVLANIDNVKGESLKNKLRDGVEIAKTSQYLATIDLNTPIDFDFESTHLTVLDTQKVGNFFKKMEFMSLLRQIPSLQVHFKTKPVEMEEEPKEQKPVPQGQLSLFGTIEELTENLPKEVKLEHKKIVQDNDSFEFLIKELNEVSLFSLDTETTGIDTQKADLVGISISYDKEFGYQRGFQYGDSETLNYYIPVGHDMGEQLDIDYVLQSLKPIFEDSGKNKILQNAKYEINIFQKYDINLKGIVMDTMIASYVKDSSRKHGLKQQAFSLLGLEMINIEELIGKGKNAITMNQVDIEKAGYYACFDSFATLELGKYYVKNLEEKQSELINNIELPLVDVLAYMERTGVYVDRDYLGELSGEIELNLSVVEAKIYKEAGEIFNINSPKQVGDVLFEKMMLPYGKKTKTGYSTDSNVLETLAQDYEIAKLILEQRHLSKIKSTYLVALPELISEKDGRIHTSFNQTVTTTGRLSSSNPNLQNIPIRTEIGNRIRAAFAAQNEDDLIVSADYSQIELRLLAHFSEDEKLKEAFLSNTDIHSATAASVFGVPIDEVTKEMRYKAKAVNFGIIYGQTSYGLSNAIDITPGEAKAFIEKYFETYPSIKAYLDGTVALAHQQGYIETMFGRCRHLREELSSKNRMIREFAERAATNTPLQGTAADLIKLAMIEVYKRLKEQNLESKLVLQVHDELVLEVKKSELNQVCALVKDAMELSQPLSVPLEIDLQVGRSWMESEETMSIA